MWEWYPLDLIPTIDYYGNTNGGDTTNQSNLDQWISEYPAQRRYIMRRKRFFSAHPPPHEGDTEWSETLRTLGLLEYGKSIGDESLTNSPDDPLEPPF